MRLFFIFIVLISGCTQSGSGQSATDQQEVLVDQVFADSITSFQVKVFYENGADPYVGTIGLSSNNVWDITESSYQALFQNHSGRSLSIPKTLGEMTAIADQNKSTWTQSELVALGESLSPTLIETNVATIPVIFLNGTYNGQSTVLGVQITGYHFAFVFKDVVTSVGGGSTSQQYVEQATVVHEIGHAIGLVNNGVPMVVNHEDSSHAKHTTNADCVMYWAVESSSDILTFLTDIIAGSELNLFEQESLQDGRAYHP